MTTTIRQFTFLTMMALMIFIAPPVSSSTYTNPPLERITVSADQTHFITADSHKRFIVWGVNYDHDNHDNRLLEDYWHDEWDTVADDFSEMHDLGVNLVRIHLQLGRFMKSETETNQSNLNRLADLLELAQKNSLYLDITGLGCYNKQDVPDWYDELDENPRWQVQVRFWKAVAEVCKNSPAIFCYDLMNEPILPGAHKPAPTWLAGEFAGKHFVQYITRDLKGRTRIEVAEEWVTTLTNAIREVDDSHMITVGIIPWALTFKGAKPIFYDPRVNGPLDFTAVHMYPRKGEVDKALQALKVYKIGKPLLIEETFPLHCSIEEEEKFINQTRDFADGWVSFYWGTTIEEYQAQDNLNAAIIAGWLTRYRTLIKQ